MEFRIGAGLACLGIAVGIGQWLVPPETLGYEIRFGLVVVAVCLLAFGVLLIGHACWHGMSRRKSKPDGALCYFSLYYIGNKAHIVNGHYQLAMNGIGIVEAVNYWISPFGVQPNGQPDDPYYSVDRRKPLIPIIHHGGHVWDRTLPQGDYQIDFTTKQGNWYERLRIYKANGDVKQSIRVTTQQGGKGDVLYQYEN